MTKTALRSYQSDVIDRLRASVNAGKRAPLLVAPTGSGKTVMAAAIIQGAVGYKQSVLFLAHRRELVHQAHQKLFEAGVDAGVILAGHPPRPGAAVQVASVATLWRRAVRGSAMSMPPANLILIDEAHHARSTTYRRIVAAYPNAIVIGLTATPCRADGRGLGMVFDDLVEAPSVSELVAGGFLVPTKVYAPDRPDLAGVKTSRGDYVEKQLAETMDQPKLVGSIAEHWLRLAPDRKTVLFATGVAHSLHCRDELRRGGAMAEHIDGGTPVEEREAILAAFSKGSVDVICNAMVLTEGWDCPDASALIMARPTKSISLYRQMLGRVMRPAPGKLDALILDHAGAVFEHGLPEEPIAWTLDPDSRAERPMQTARASGTAPALNDCPECHSVRRAGSACPACGWRPRRRAEAFEVEDGQLGRVDRKRRVKAGDLSVQERGRWHRMLAYIGQQKDYKSGWAAHKYREKFKEWPKSRRVVPEPASPEVHAWVRSRQIAYAKGMEKRRAG